MLAFKDFSDAAKSIKTLEGFVSDIVVNDAWIDFRDLFEKHYPGFISWWEKHEQTIGYTFADSIMNSPEHVSQMWQAFSNSVVALYDPLGRVDWEEFLPEIPSGAGITMTGPTGDTILLIKSGLTKLALDYGFKVYDKEICIGDEK